MRKPDIDDDLLREAFELYARERYYSPEAEEAAAAVSFSPEFEERMDKLFQQEKQPFYALFNTVGKRVAVAVLAALLGLTLTTFSVKALRDPVLRFITEMFERFTSIVFVQVDEPATAAAYTFEKREPDYIPEGYRVENVRESSESYMIEYSHNSNQLIRYHQQARCNAEAIVDTEDTGYVRVDINGMEGVLCRNKECYDLTFHNDDYKFCLLVPLALGEEELLRIAESIVETQ